MKITEEVLQNLFMIAKSFMEHLRETASCLIATQTPKVLGSLLA